MGIANLIPAPYMLYAKIGAAVLVVVTIFGSGYHIRGTKADKDILSIKNAAQAALIVQQQKVAVYEAAQNAIVHNVEVMSNENAAKQKADASKYAAIVAANGGLYDFAASTSNSPATTSTGSTATSTGSNRLSTELSDYLITQATLADQVVSQYTTCQQYVIDITAETRKAR